MKSENQRRKLASPMQKKAQTNGLSEESKTPGAKIREFDLPPSSVESKLFRSSVKGSFRAREIFDQMKAARYEKHKKTMQEYEQWNEEFKESMKQEYEKIKKINSSLKTNTDEELEAKLDKDDLSQQANERSLANLKERIKEVKGPRKEEIGNYEIALKELLSHKKKTISEYVTNLQHKLISIGFLLEPQIITLIQEILSKHQEEIENESKRIEELVKALLDKEENTFAEYNTKWNAKKDRYHSLNQNQSLEGFKEQLNSSKFVNPLERQERVKEFMNYQTHLFNKRKQLLHNLKEIGMKNMGMESVGKIEEELKELKEEASSSLKQFTEDYLNIQKAKKDEGMQLAKSLKEYLEKNKASLPADKTYEKIIKEQCYPLIELRFDEGKKLLAEIEKAFTEFDTRTHEHYKNIVEFYKLIAYSFDSHKEKVQNLELNNENAIQSLSDDNISALNKRNEEIKMATEGIRKAATHKELVKKLEDSYSVYNEMDKDYTLYVNKLKQLTTSKVPILIEYFKELEHNLIRHFKLETMDKKELIEERLLKETEERQKKLVEEYAKKKGLAALPKNIKPINIKGKQIAQKYPNLRRLQMPKLKIYEAPSGELYIVDYELETIVDEIIPPTELQPKEIKEEELVSKSKEKMKEAKKVMKEVKELVKEENIPRDPEGNECLQKQLFINREEVLEMIQLLFKNVTEHANEYKNSYMQELDIRNKEVVEQRMQYFDNLFQTSWPNDDTIDEEVFQMRQSEISNHKKILEKHIRSIKAKSSANDKEFQDTIKEVKGVSDTYNSSMKKYLGENCEDPVELQRIINEVKQVYNEFSNQLSSYRKILEKIQGEEMDKLLQENENFIRICVLEEAGGSYSEEEKEYYKVLLSKIDSNLESRKEEMLEVMKELFRDANSFRDGPYYEFENKVAEANEDLAAKEGMGNKFGKPKLILQEQMKAEIDKCNVADSEIEKMLKRLKNLLQEYRRNEDSYFLNRRPMTLSLDIRRTLVILRNCILKYGMYIGAFKEGFIPEELKRITNDETRKSIELDDKEKKNDERVKEEEIHVLGKIGINLKQTFNTSMERIENEVKDIITKLYTGKYTKYLQGINKIPQHLDLLLKEFREKMISFRMDKVNSLSNIVILMIP